MNVDVMEYGSSGGGCDEVGGSAPLGASHTNSLVWFFPCSPQSAQPGHVGQVLWFELPQIMN